METGKRIDRLLDALDEVHKDIATRAGRTRMARRELYNGGRQVYFVNFDIGAFLL